MDSFSFISFICVVSQGENQSKRILVLYQFEHIVKLGSINSMIDLFSSILHHSSGNADFGGSISISPMPKII